MARKKLILVPSKKMDENKKGNRNENSLVRMSRATRDNMSFVEDSVELYPHTGEASERINNSMLLKIFQAFSSDIKKLKAEGYSRQELCKVGFVTTKTYRKITGSKGTEPDRDIWVSDSVYDTVIGADPEFLLFNNNKQVVRANNVLGFHGPIGCDGAMAEIRPHPAITPEGVVAHIKKLLDNQELVSSISSYNWMAGCYHRDSARDYPIGGHLHIGNPVQLTKVDLRDRLLFFKSFNKILDTFLGLPLIKLDGEELGKLRRTGCTVGNYGYFGEFRLCSGRLEYRTLSGLWLAHPELTMAVMGVAKAVIDEVFRCVAENKFDLEYMFPSKLKSNNVWSPEFDRWGDIPVCADLGCTEGSAMFVSFLHESKASEITPKYLKEWYNRIRKLTTYKEYSVYIDNLYEILKNDSKILLGINKKIQCGWLEGEPFLK